MLYVIGICILLDCSRTARDPIIALPYLYWWYTSDAVTVHTIAYPHFASKNEVLTAVIAGLSGGRLPSSFNNVDCETYAILAYIRKVCELKEGETEAGLKKKRVCS